MNEKELIHLLSQAKTSPEFGGDLLDADREQGWMKISEGLGFDAQDAQSSYRLRDYIQYYAWSARRGMVQQVMVTLVVCLVAFGGWAGAVNASFNSVPGDILYPVKLVSEKLQLTFAASAQRRVTLQTEFAGRRLHEVTQITHSDVDQKPERIRAAVQDFKRKLASANKQLEELKRENPEEAVTVATAIDQNVQAYDQLLDAEALDAPTESEQDVEEAREAASESDTQVVTTLVESHETAGSVMTKEAVKRSFQDRYESIKQRIAFSFGRLTVIERVVESRGAWQAQRQIIDARSGVSAHDRSLAAALDTMAAGGVRKAFELLDQISDEVAASEFIIAKLELELTTPVEEELAEEEPQEEEEALTEPDVVEEEAERPLNE